MKRVLLFALCLTLTGLLAACGGGPSDGDVETAIEKGFKDMKSMSMGLASGEVLDIDIGDMKELEDGIYEVETTVKSRIKFMGNVQEREEGVVVKLREINGVWTMIQ